MKHRLALCLGPDLPAPLGMGWNTGIYSVLLGRVDIFHRSLLISHLFYPDPFPVSGEHHLPSLQVQEGLEGDRPTQSLQGAVSEAGSPCAESRDWGKREEPYLPWSQGWYFPVSKPLEAPKWGNVQQSKPGCALSSLHPSLEQNSGRTSNLVCALLTLLPSSALFLPPLPSAKG